MKLLFAAYIISQALLLALWLSVNIPTTRLTTICTCITLCSYILFSAVSYLEHLRSLRPSTMLCTYLGVSTILDLARVRTLFYIPRGDLVAAVFLASFLVKILVLVMEVTEKRTLILPGWSCVSPEATAGVYNRALFIWLNGVFLKGFRTYLTIDVLTPLDDQLTSASKPSDLEATWAKGDTLTSIALHQYTNCLPANKSTKNALLWSFLFHYKWAFLSGVLPRLAYSGLTFAQPFLVQRVLDFTGQPVDSKSNDIAYGLIGAYGLVYIGLAVRLSFH